MSGEYFLGTIGQDSSVSKTDWFHVDISRFFFTKIKEYSANPSQWIGHFAKALNVNRLFLKLDRFMYK